MLLFCLVLFASLGATPSAKAADDVPAWVRQAVSTRAPAYGKKVSAVVLLNEKNIKVEEDGKVTTSERYAIRILTNEGKRAARGSVFYITESSKVKDMKGWLVRPTEQVKKYGKDEILDRAAALNDVFNEVRVKAINAASDAEPDAVFAYEAVSEDRSVFTQFDWEFQDDLPVLMSRFSLTLPTGWRAESVTFNHQKIEPIASGSTYTWELQNLSVIEDEPASPPASTLAPRLAVSYFPAEGKSILGKSFSSWAEVSRWLYELSDAQAVTADPLATKARELTANAKTEYEKIQALGRYAQGVNYVAIQTGIGRGGGYRPHSSIDVFNKSYGDCKDKANLMRAMLKAIGITSYLVSIYSGDPTFVREEWPSPQQFNHCIIAVKVNDETQAATVINHPTLGKLLIFDPTDDDTPVGDLPDHEQNSLALIVTADGSSLVRMPITPAESNLLERQIEATLTVDGSLSAKVRERSNGQKAVEFRREFRHLSRPDYIKGIERWITQGATGATVSKVEPVDNNAEGKFTLDVEFSAPRYAQSMQGRLLVFKPAIVSRRDSLFLTDENRQHPVVLDAQAYTEVVKVKLPDGFEVDEIPNPVKLDTPFGSYKVSYEVKDGFLSFSRSMIIRGAMIPANDYEKVKRFYATMRAAEQAPVVLAKK
jgi:hypothetical protein